MDVLKWLADGLLLSHGVALNGKVTAAGLCCLSYSYWWVDEVNADEDQVGELPDHSAQPYAL